MGHTEQEFLYTGYFHELLRGPQVEPRLSAIFSPGGSPPPTVEFLPADERLLVGRISPVSIYFHAS